MVLHAKHRRNPPRPGWSATALCLCGCLLTGCGPAKSTPAGPQTNKPPTKTASTGKTDTNAPPARVEIPKSTFVDNLKEGIDPFFPKSTRRQPKLNNGAKAGTAAQPQDPFAEITLNGILGSSRRRIATINNRPFETGETGEITLTGGKRVQIKCLRIDEASVEIALQGEPERRRKVNLRKEF